MGTLAEPRSQNALRHLHVRAGVSWLATACSCCALLAKRLTLPPLLCLQESAPFLRVLGSYPMDLELGVVDSDKPVGFGGDVTGQA